MAKNLFFKNFSFSDSVKFRRRSRILNLHFFKLTFNTMILFRSISHKAALHLHFLFSHQNFFFLQRSRILKKSISCGLLFFQKRVLGIFPNKLWSVDTRRLACYRLNKFISANYLFAVLGLFAISFFLRSAPQGSSYFFLWHCHKLSHFVTLSPGSAAPGCHLVARCPSVDCPGFPLSPGSIPP